MLNIDMEFKKGILIVRLKGIMNRETVKKVENDLETVIKNNGIKYVLLNFNKLEYIDNDGIEVITNSYKQILKNKGKLIICGINKLLEKTNFLTENLYQVKDEMKAHEIINI